MSLPATLSFKSYRDLKRTDHYTCMPEAIAVTLFVYVRIFVQILVKNAPWDITLRQLEQFFSRFGKVKAITASFFPGTTRTNAVVTYFNLEDAWHANRTLTAGHTEPRQIQLEMQTGTKRSNPPSYSGSGGSNSQSRGVDHGLPRGASKRARESVTSPASPTTWLTPPMSPPTSPAVAYVGNQVGRSSLGRMLVPSASRVADSIAGLCSLAADGRIIV